jgi:hypothetical protein
MVVIYPVNSGTGKGFRPKIEERNASRLGGVITYMPSVEDGGGSLFFALNGRNKTGHNAKRSNFDSGFVIGDRCSI